MIWNVISIHIRRLAHNRIELLLTFVVPVAFFSIFAVIFAGGVGGSSMPKIKVAIADEVNSEESQELILQLKQDPSLRLMRDESAASISRKTATRWVRDGSMTMVIVVTRRAGDVVAQYTTPDADRQQSTPLPTTPGLRVELLADASDQVASQVVTSVVARSLGAMQAKATPMDFSNLPPPPAEFQSDTGSRLAAIPRSDGGPALRLIGPQLNASVGPPSTAGPDVAPETAAVLADVDLIADPSTLVRVVDVIGEGKSNPVVSMYAAGIAVMFLLFGATGGGGTLLEERENQTLDRLLSTQMTMDQLLLGKWLYLSVLGIVQVTVMFIWAQIVFGVDLLHHLDGFLMMTMVTSAAAAAFGLFLATLCKSRGQLNGLSVILVLTMSALGGSMVPRYVMSQKLRDWGLWTFNAWALDGYDKVFWRELPVDQLAPQLTVLMISGISFLVLARLLAVRWETE